MLIYIMHSCWLNLGSKTCAFSSAWLEHHLDMVGVGGSSPLRRTILAAGFSRFFCAQNSSMPACAGFFVSKFPRCRPVPVFLCPKFLDAGFSRFFCTQNSSMPACAGFFVSKNPIFIFPITLFLIHYFLSLASVWRCITFSLCMLIESFWSCQQVWAQNLASWLVILDTHLLRQDVCDEAQGSLSIHAY